MRWQIKLQNRRTLEVDDKVLREFRDEDVNIKGRHNDFRKMLDEINAELSDDEKAHKMLLVCNELDEHFVNSYVKDVSE